MCDLLNHTELTFLFCNINDSSCFSKLEVLVGELIYYQSPFIRNALLCQRRLLYVTQTFMYYFFKKHTVLSLLSPVITGVRNHPASALQAAKFSFISKVFTFTQGAQ